MPNPIPRLWCWLAGCVAQSWAVGWDEHFHEIGGVFTEEHCRRCGQPIKENQ